jgi:hypothetical protein
MPRRRVQGEGKRQRGLSSRGKGRFLSTAPRKTYFLLLRRVLWTARREPIVVVDRPERYDIFSTARTKQQPSRREDLLYPCLLPTSPVSGEPIHYACQPRLSNQHYLDSLITFTYQWKFESTASYYKHAYIFGLCNKLVCMCSPETSVIYVSQR